MSEKHTAAPEDKGTPVYRCEKTRIVKQVATLTDIAKDAQDAEERFGRYIELGGESAWKTVEEITGYAGVPGSWKERASELVAELEAITAPDVLLKQVKHAGKMANFLREIAVAPSSPAADDKPIDCSGDPSSCPDNEGRGCYCSDKQRAALSKAGVSA